MLKTCTGCGSQRFHAEVREELAMPRKPEFSGYREVVDSLVCAECGERFDV
jgi:hypothetical protein